MIVIAIYLSGRFEREAWRRDRDGLSQLTETVLKPVIGKKPAQPSPSQAPSQVRKEPHIDDNIKNRIVDDEEVKSHLASEPELEAEQEPELQPDDRSGDQKKLQRHTSVGISSEEDIEKVLEKSTSQPLRSSQAASQVNHEEPLRESKNEIPKTSDDWGSAVNSAREPLIEDEIVEVDIPEELTGLESQSESKAELKFRPDVEEPLQKIEPVQQELLLEIEPLVVVLTVMAKGDNFFNGAMIKKTLQDSGLVLDDRGIFNFHMTGKKDPIFSVVSVIEPGIFDMNTIRDYSTPGLSIFCQLPGPLPNADLFRIMHMKALNLAEKLGGQLCDDRRNLLTEQSTTHYNDKIKEFDRELVLARKKRE